MLSKNHNNKVIEDKTNSNQFTILPGSAYSKYATPLDYMPSRNFNLRYGNSRCLLFDLYKNGLKNIKMITAKCYPL